jgi:SHS2 domain-containing protein
MDKNQPETSIREILHTADEEIEVSGSSIEQLFFNAANGMLLLMGIVKKNRMLGKEKISLEENDLESLLVTFLNEIIYFVEQKKFPVNLKVSIKDQQLECTFDVVPVISILKEIKAVTFHHVKIRQIRNQFRTRVVFDI